MSDYLHERIDRLLGLIEDDAPDVILQHVAASIVESMTVRWPELWTILGEHMQKRLRNSSGVCCDCGKTEIPAILTHPIDCRFCDEVGSADLRKHGVDPHEPNPPDVEEILVDLTNDECAKVRNLSEPLVDGLARLLEARSV